MSLERKIKRNEIRNQFGQKNIKKEFRMYQINKYGLANYAKMQHKSVDEILKEEM
jgi:hypothetical protein